MTHARAQDPARSLQQIRYWLIFFIVALAFSGVTAIPLETEMNMLLRILGGEPQAGQGGVIGWVVRVRDALADTNARYPFLAYGTDWLAFAHIVIAIAFIGPLRDPVKNVWVIEFGMIACVLIVPFALIMGGVRGIPLGWRLIDCSFGVLGIIPLWLCRRKVREMVAAGVPS